MTSFADLDPSMHHSMHHYVKTKSATVVQIHGASPLHFNTSNRATIRAKRSSDATFG
ncbi:MAG: hypothetical protein LAO06_13425 [Acidobacteriia bacterium]|nr:hypothetical protein [Terriglobia bacterium]